ncbi:MAG: ATP-binding protein, partial [Chthoniobacterales bacterium]|nr:ATP-binding protein [Chthoniobacterales bacterium]
HNRPYILSQRIHGYFLPIPFPSDHISGFSHMQQETHIIPIPSMPGFLLITIRDVTPMTIADNRLKQLQRELDNALDQARWENRAKEEFLNMVSHDLRTPMNAVIGFATLLSESNLSNEQREFVNAITSSSKMLLTLLNDILDFSKMEAGKLELNPHPFNLPICVQRSLRLNSSLAEEKKLQLDCSFQQNLPQTIIADESRFQQILVNLINNAIKFTDHGYVHVRVGGEPLPQNKWLLEVSVEDSGIGIPQDQLPYIFQPFRQGPDSEKRGGSGLGLTITKKLCEILDGNIEVSSSEGKGSCFTFRIPVQLDPSSTPNTSSPTSLTGNSHQIPSQDTPNTPSSTSKTDAAAIPPHSDSLPTPQPLSTPSESSPLQSPQKTQNPIRALVVDDVAMNRKLAQVILQKLGCSVDCVDSANEALKALKSKDYDIVFMDIKMPDISGIEAASLIRSGAAGDKNRNILICALTALASHSTRQQCLEAGMNDFVAKPLRSGDIEAALHRLKLL